MWHSESQQKSLKRFSAAAISHLFVIACACAYLDNWSIITRMYLYPAAALSNVMKPMTLKYIGDVEITIPNEASGVMCCFSTSSADQTSTLLLFIFNFCVLAGVFVLQVLLWFYLFPGFVDYLKIYLTCMIGWLSSSCYLMLTVFHVCVDWWRVWSSCSFN